jgi:hypothetical protein
MDWLQVDVLGIPWLGTGLIILGALGTGLVASVVVKTVRQMRDDDDDEVTQPRTAPKRKKAAKADHGKNNNHQDILSPMGKNGSRTMFDRVAPLFYEESKDGKWKVSLGRVSFWMVLVTFLGMCIAVQTSLSSATNIDPNLPTLYLGVISMVFLTLLGLLGYNLGSKFTEPMSKFIVLWAQNRQGIIPTVQPAAAPSQPTPPAQPVEEPDAPQAADGELEEGMPSPNEDPEAG